MQPTTGNWFTRGGWWFFVHVLSFGILSPVPFAHAAVRTRRSLHTALAVVYLVLVILCFTLIGISPKGADGRVEGPTATAGGMGIILILLGGIVHLIFLRQQVFGDPREADPRHADPSVQAALQARQKRSEARQLAANDPLMAREVRIGRPDLVRTYDDGGLVDLNSAPAPVIATVLGVEPAIAELVVAARTAAGRFYSVDDVFSYADLPLETWDVVRDRGIVLAP